MLCPGLTAGLIAGGQRVLHLPVKPHKGAEANEDSLKMWYNLNSGTLSFGNVLAMPGATNALGYFFFLFRKKVGLDGIKLRVCNISAFSRGDFFEV